MTPDTSETAETVDTTDARNGPGSNARGAIGAIGRRFAAVRPSRKTLLWGAILLNAELLAVVAYVSLPSVTPTAFEYYAYPFVWINVGLWAIVRTRPPSASVRRQYAAGALAVGYFLVLAYAGGLIGPGRAVLNTAGYPYATGFRIAMLPPGWGPAPIYVTDLVRIVLMPFMLVGYVALSYLVYATVLDAAGSAIGGALGLLSCVSCTWPVLAALVGTVAGSTSGIAAAVTAQSYELSTLVFLLTVALLSWRPSDRR